MRTNDKTSAVQRGRLLEVLYLAAMSGEVNPDDPFAMSRRTLEATLEQLRELPSPEIMAFNLRYLEGKRYVAVEWTNDGRGGWDSVRLLPAGVELVEGASSDALVYLIRRG